VVFAFLAMKKHFGQAYGDDPEIKSAISETLDRKGTLLTRPMEFLLADPHLLAGWLSINRKNFKFENGKLLWLRNPLVILEETYEYLNMTWREDAPAAEVIWTHDRDLLQNALDFYAELRNKFGLEKDEFLKLNEILGKATPQGGFDKDTWAKIQASHLGFEVGNELFGMLFLIADRTDFFDFKVEDDLEVTIPDYLNDPDLQAAMKKILVPPPATKADEIVTPGGGMYYAQEAPGMPSFVKEGEHFDKGQPLFILEVMKMFNKVPAPFSGTVDKILIEGGDGVIVKKGQPIFKVTPDEKFVDVDPKEIEAQKRATTAAYLEDVL
jgi:biotin carboxyl carrier protein